MRILYLCGDHGVPAFGRKGASTHVREMISALRRAGHEVALAASDLSGDRRDNEMFRTFKLLRPRAKWMGTDFRYILADRFADSVLRTAVTRWNPDVIYERSALYFRAGERLSRSFQLPRILEVNTLLAEESMGRLHLPALAGRVEGELIRAAQGVAAISDVMVERLVEELHVEPDRCRVFPMAVDPVRFAPHGRRAIKRAQLGVDDRTPLIGYIGSLNAYHRPRWFLDLARSLTDEGRDVVMAFVGGSDWKVEPLSEECRSLPPPVRIHCVGTVPQSELPDWIEAMDLVVVPGASPQSTPTKLFEVAAVGRPVLVPDTRPLRMLCGKAAPQCLFDAEDFQDMVAKVRQFLDGDNALHHAVPALRERILGEYTWDAQAARLLSWFEELLPATSTAAPSLAHRT